MEVNVKHVAITMGIVPDNEYKIVFECAGIVTRLGLGVTKFKVGDHVCIFVPSSYANRVRVSFDRRHITPAIMSYEEAATTSLVYLTSIYSLYHLANLKDGQVRTNSSQQILISVLCNIWYDTDKITVHSHPVSDYDYFLSWLIHESQALLSKWK